MSQTIRYGLQGVVTLTSPLDLIFGDIDLPLPIDDPAAAVAAALDHPLEFPPLSQATAPGDRVAIAIDGRTPCAAAIVAGVVLSLRQSGAEPDEIRVVVANCDAAGLELLKSQLPADLASSLEFEVHEPSVKEAHSYLCVSKDGKPIQVNRSLFDADVVLPIGMLRLDDSLGYLGVHGDLFPNFSDEATQARFRAPSSSEIAVHQRRRRAEADEAAWLMGVQFTIQVVPGPGDSLFHVLAGEANRVLQEGARLCEAAWLREVPQRADLVIAAIEGGSDQQTWENFGRALFAASQAVQDDGAIVICTDLETPPGPALQRLMGPGESDHSHADIRRDRSTDALSASLLADVLQRQHVYLLSKLDDDLVEEMGLAPIASPEDIDRLSRRFDTCLVLANAQHALARTADGR
ncbi:lactate racemase domain-containing protein [Lignipirellula cremea]|uniref:LarA-like N-terminal domain-containing protein n=1 Tax=Lignipirellula cremea TaxID=2528010 RepID=A0A518DYV8_9BACT|nr:lactate racemase domain-containing protein [Lignipirellula cremea]QDU96981.1 hypothetical protein Pla8534_48060 [Lignipirellula cremea]